jgi:glycosyltransferase involved in cell wall biosynthesis
MKLYYLSDSLIPSQAANSVQVMKMCTAFAKLGHAVTLFARKNTVLSVDPYDYYGLKPDFQLRYYTLMTAKRVKSFKRVSTWLTRWQIRVASPDLIYGRDAKMLLAVATLGIPFVFEEHFLSAKRIRRLERIFNQPNFMRLVVITRALMDDCLAQCSSLDTSKIFVAQDGADASLAHGYPGVQLPGNYRIGYLGHLYPGKGMKIISKLPVRCPYATFHIVGGEQKDVMYWQSQLSSKSNMHFHGFVPHRDTSSYLRAFDVVLAPYQHRVEARSGMEISRWMSPLKVFEYMAAGKPIIASDLPVLREVLENGRNALLVPPEDTAAWVNAIHLLHDDVALRQHLGRQALQDFNTKYSWDIRAKAVLEGVRHKL